MSLASEEQFMPILRRLRVFAFDPGLALHMDTTVINEIAVKIPFELDPKTGQSGLLPGPVGEYLEVIDYDPASKAYYAPVDLNDPSLLAQDGLTPSEGNPQFHQQMVYTVAMTTIGHFERALGRVILWAPRKVRDKKGKLIRKEYIPKLRIYPHAFREANAYYSHSKKALLFGYFTTSRKNRDNAPGTMVFTCLSHDIIAHETTHALLDGLHPRFGESTNEDTLALHEAFADIVAIFQHFANPEVLRNQIARTRGNLADQNLLAKLAQQFGRAMGRSGALRDALGYFDENNEWRPLEPDASKLDKTKEPHARGAILVAAVFDAFLLIYKSRIADLLRIATHGTGVLPKGEIHPDLVGRLADEASKSSRHILQMCIRALDYCPPVDVNFGDFLRAIITADYDLNPEDEHHYRVAVVEAFRRRGILPRGIRHLSLDSLRWPNGLQAQQDVLEPTTEVVPAGPTREEQADMEKQQRMAMQSDIQFLFDRSKAMEEFKSIMEKIKDKKDEPEPEEVALLVDWDLSSNRDLVQKNIEHNGRIFHRWLTQGSGRKYVKAFGLTLNEDAPPSVYRSADNKTPSVEIHSVRTALRRGAKGSLVTELVVEITQQRRGYLDPKEQKKVDSGKRKIAAEEKGDFRFRRGCTILINPKTMEVRRVVRTEGDVSDNAQLERIRAFITREDPHRNNAFKADPYRSVQDDDAFARLHQNFK